MKWFLFFSVFTLCLQANALDKKSYEVDVQLSPAGSFAITGKISGKIVRQGNNLMADSVSANVKRLKTGLDMRDDHTKEKLDVKKFPKVEIVKAMGSGGKGKAIISVKGIKKDINFTYQEKGDEVIAEFKLKLSDFGFTGINYMGVGVKDDVTVKANIPVK